MLGDPVGVASFKHAEEHFSAIDTNKWKYFLIKLLCASLEWVKSSHKSNGCKPHLKRLKKPTRGEPPCQYISWCPWRKTFYRLSQTANKDEGKEILPACCEPFALFLLYTFARLKKIFQYQQAQENTHVKFSL